MLKNQPTYSFCVEHKPVGGKHVRLSVMLTILQLYLTGWHATGFGMSLGLKIATKIFPVATKTSTVVAILWPICISDS